MVIDFHTHIFPDKIVERTMKALSESSDEHRPHLDGRLTSLIASMDQSDIDASVIAHIATKPDHAQAVLKWSLEIKSSRIIPLASVHPTSHSYCDELDLFAKAGFTGVKLHPMYQSFSVDARALYPLYEKIESLGMFILFHAGYDAAYPGNTNATPDKFSRVLKDFPKLTVIASHLGGWFDWDNVLTHLAGKNLYLETSFIDFIKPSLRDSILAKHNADLILFGSDSPWCGQHEQRDFIESLSLGSNVTEKILGGNAARLLHIV